MDFVEKFQATTVLVPKRNLSFLYIKYGEYNWCEMFTNYKYHIDSFCYKYGMIHLRFYDIQDNIKKIHIHESLLNEAINNEDLYII